MESRYGHVFGSSSRVFFHVRSFKTLELENVSTTNPAPYISHEGISNNLSCGFRISQNSCVLAIYLAGLSLSHNVIANVEYMSQVRIHLVLSCANVKSLDSVLVIPSLLIFTFFFLFFRVIL